MSSLAPPGALVAAYAAVVDGESLWLDVGGAAGTPGVRLEDGVIVPLATVVEESNGRQALRADLAGAPDLAADREWAGEVVLLGAGGRAEPLWVAPPPVEAPTVPPLTRDGRRFVLRRAPEGWLRLRHRPPVRFVEALGYDGSDTEVVLLLPPAVTGTVILRSDDGVLATFPLEHADDVARARLSVVGAFLPTERVPTSVLVGTEDASLPVGRRANALADPGDQTVPLPVVHDETGRPRLRLRYRPGGLLAAVVLPVDDERGATP